MNMNGYLNSNFMKTNDQVQVVNFNAGYFGGALRAPRGLWVSTPAPSRTGKVQAALSLVNSASKSTALERAVYLVLWASGVAGILATML